MPTITLTLPIAGTGITAGLHATNYTTIQTAVNGLDANNWAAGKIFAPSKLTQEGATVGQVPVWNGSIWAPATQGSPGYAITLPGSPTDGQQTILTDSVSAPTWAWLLRYNATSTKWDFLGGAPIYAEVVTSEATASITYAALATAGPNIALPVAGDYIVEAGFAYVSVSSAQVFMSYDIGGTGAVDADAVIGASASGSGLGGTASIMRVRKKTGLTAVTLTAKYRVDNAVSKAFQNRWIRVTPIRVG